ncbi:MAG: acetyl-CoA carboxylase carboxyltransferase subunit beta [Candidatus Omnitrophica bacterium]|nr:acetyl-CoA carboxylase carboxyltransferase subunit beta [Candidatus Omnitrophota bacterium]
MAWFKKRKYAVLPIREKREIKKDLWEKCDSCGRVIYKKILTENLKVCPKCEHHFRLTAEERINLILDENSFQESDKEISSADPLDFRSQQPYQEKLKEAREKTGLSEAVIAGEGKLSGCPIILAVSDSHFIMGSMGSVVGEKIARAAESALEKKIPFLSVSAGGGGARMHEGMLSLMQMAKTASAIGKLKRAGVLYISLLTDPTMAGVAASYALLGDIILAEPKALIGFTGPRVIEQTIRQKLPKGFQRSEFLFKHGMIDLVLPRKEIKPTLAKILSIFSK